MESYFSAFDPNSSAKFLVVGNYVRYPRPFIPTMTTDKADGTPNPTDPGISIDSKQDEDLPTIITNNHSTHTKFPIRLNIRTRNRNHDVNPFAVIKAFLLELRRHDPTLKLGDHGEVFYSPNDFPSNQDDFEAAFHGCHCNRVEQETDQYTLRKD